MLYLESICSDQERYGSAEAIDAGAGTE